MNDQDTLKINVLSAEIVNLRKLLANAESKRDHYRSELQRLQASRGVCNHRKARRLARKMSSALEGQVQS